MNTSITDDRARGYRGAAVPGSCARVVAAAVACVCACLALPAATESVAILHTTDLHGNLLPVTDYEGNEGVGGILQLAPLVEQERAAHPCTILVDNGDTFQGSPHSFLTRGAAVIDALNALDVSIWNLGNHDFDWGTEALEANIARFSGAVISANCQWSGSTPSPFERVKPYVITNVGGRRIAFVGVTHPKIPYWSRLCLVGDAVIEQPMTALLRVMPAVYAERPDAIVLLAHLGYNDRGGMFEDPLYELLGLFHGFDAVIGGHTHTAVPFRRAGGAMFTQAAYHGIALGDLRLSFSNETGKLSGVTASLVPVGPGQPWSAMVSNAVAPVLAQADALMTGVVCTIDGVLSNEFTESGESALQTLICEAIAATTRADVVFHGSFQTPATVSNRPLTMADLYRIVPYENLITVAQMTPAAMLAVMETLMEYWGSHYFAVPYGLCVTVDPDALPGERVVSMTRRDGSPLDPARRYAVAFNSYMAASSGMRQLPVRALIDGRDSGAADLPVLTRDALEAYLRACGTYTPRVTRSIAITDEPGPSIGPVTPSTPFVPGPVRFAEFAYTVPGPLSDEPAGEWFAVRNIFDRPVNLKGYSFSDNDDKGVFSIEKDLLLAPGELLVFCSSVPKFRRLPYGASQYLRIFEYGRLAPRLNLGNRGDELVMLAPNGHIADQVTYGRHTALWRNWPADTKAPNHKPGEGLVKTQGGWQVNTRPLTEEE